MIDYKKAAALDDAFQAALAAEYGKLACEMRYRTNELPAHVKTLALAYQSYMASVDRMGVK